MNMSSFLDFLLESYNQSDREALINSAFQANIDNTLAFKVTMVCCYILLFIIGVIGNSLVIVCILMFPNMRTLTNLFLLNLSISDLMVFLFCEPWTAAHLLSPQWNYGEVLCKVHAVLNGMSVGVSISTLVSISIERFVIIKYPLRYRAHIGASRVALWVALTWLIPLSVFGILYWAHETTAAIESGPMTIICVETWHNYDELKKLFTLLVFVLFYLLPVTFMGLIYLKLMRKFWSTPPLLHEQTVQLNPTVAQTNRQRQRRRISCVLLALYVVFVICWLPYQLLNLWVDIFSHSDASTMANWSPPSLYARNALHNSSSADWMVEAGSAESADSSDSIHFVTTYLYPIAHFLCYLNSALDPFCSLLVSAKFRMALRRIRACHCLGEGQATPCGFTFWRTFQFSLRPPNSAERSSSVITYDRHQIYSRHFEELQMGVLPRR